MMKVGQEMKYDTFLVKLKDNYVNEIEAWKNKGWQDTDGLYKGFEPITDEELDTDDYSNMIRITTIEER